MFIFKDRDDAGKQLARALLGFRDKANVVLAIPRGGIEVGFQVAVALQAEFSILVVRKLPFPDNPESGFGAVAEGGSLYLLPEAGLGLSAPTIERIIREQRAEILRRIKVLRHNRPLADLRGRQVILVDDGIATGSTVQAAVMDCRKAGARRVIVAAPVAAPEARAALENSADQLVIVLKPRFFRAVADFYENWRDVGDEEAYELLLAAGQALQPKRA